VQGVRPITILLRGRKNLCWTAICVSGGEKRLESAGGKSRTKPGDFQSWGGGGMGVIGLLEGVEKAFTLSDTEGGD